MSVSSPSDAELCGLSVAEASRKIGRKEVSSEELTRALLHRIESLDGRLSAFVTVTRDVALAQAREADNEIARGNRRGPLHGIPYAAKDIFDTAGILTTGNSRICIDRIPKRDATAVRLMRDAGAVLLGKLTTHEFAHGGPSFDLPWPPARNPWNTACYTGGSSSGAGAALAARLCPLALGSDTGGSIRGPASWSGVTGLMPTFGLVSRAGVIPNSFTFDHCGPMTRSAEDCAIALETLAAFDPCDPGSVESGAMGYCGALTGDLRGMRIGVLRNPAAAATLAAFESALDVLRGLGAELSEASWPTPREAVDIKVVIAEAEIFSVHAAALRQRPKDFGWDFLQRALPACLFSSVDYIAALRALRRIRAEMMKELVRFDVLVSVGQGPAPRLDAHDPMGFWKNADHFVLANVAAGPAIAFCNGFSSDGLPVGMQVIGRPFSDRIVLRVAHAYQSATDWHLRVPAIYSRSDLPLMDPPVRPTSAGECPTLVQGRCDEATKRAGLSLDESDHVLLYRAAPYAIEMADRICTNFGFSESPASIFQISDRSF